MACGCTKRNGEKALEETIESPSAVQTAGSSIVPTTQCIACAQKHIDEAWECFHEYGYSRENRRHIRGALRAIVLHTYKEWPQIAKLARKAALEVQEANDTAAEASIDELCGMIDDAFDLVNPEIVQKIEGLAGAKK